MREVSGRARAPSAARSSCLAREALAGAALRVAVVPADAPPFDMRDRPGATGHLTAAIAEDHGASILHYDADFERLAARTDLAAAVEALTPLGTCP